jgi:hypothetical protein
MKKSTLLIEAQNLAEVTAILLSKNYMVYRPEADIDGVDIVLKNPKGELIKCQLKGRSHVESNKYGKRDIWMLFPQKGEPFKRNWYLIKHDELLKIQKNRHGKAPKWNDSLKGEYWTEEVGVKLSDILEEFSIYKPDKT